MIARQQMMGAQGYGNNMGMGMTPTASAPRGNLTPQPQQQQQNGGRAASGPRQNGSLSPEASKGTKREREEDHGGERKKVAEATV
jgi:hypothetical protein